MAHVVGFLVNPIAGMGGRVGLKGTDSPEVLERARELGATPVAPDRARAMLNRLAEQVDVTLLTGPGPMGETVAVESGYVPTVVGDLAGDTTTPSDTRAVATALVERGVDILVFAGGDGTARDVHDAVGDAVPVVGVPAGVKIYSGVFSPNPQAAADLVVAFLHGKTRPPQLREVMDIDEAAYREGHLSATLYGYLRVPQHHSLVQNPKAGGSGDEAASKRSIARAVVESMEEGRLYIVGPGTTTAEILTELGLSATLLGVDAVRDGRLVGSDLNEGDLLALLDGQDATLVVGVLGGQGFVFGRGNQQLSPRVIERVGVENITIVATRDKLTALGSDPLRVDTGDPAVDETLTGYRRVITGRGEQMVVRVAR